MATALVLVVPISIPITIGIREILDQLLQPADHGVHLFPRVVLAEGESHRDLIGVIIDSADNMRSLLDPACTGAAAGSADMMDVKIEKQHLRLLRLWKINTQHRIQTPS